MAPMLYSLVRFAKPRKVLEVCCFFFYFCSCSCSCFCVCFCF